MLMHVSKGHHNSYITASFPGVLIVFMWNDSITQLVHMDANEYIVSVSCMENFTLLVCR
jgi:hypothetical protein